MNFSHLCLFKSCPMLLLLYLTFTEKGCKVLWKKRPRSASVVTLQRAHEERSSVKTKKGETKPQENLYRAILLGLAFGTPDFISQLRVKAAVSKLKTTVPQTPPPSPRQRLLFRYSTTTFPSQSGSRAVACIARHPGRLCSRLSRPPWHLIDLEMMQCHSGTVSAAHRGGGEKSFLQTPDLACMPGFGKPWVKGSSANIPWQVICFSGKNFSPVRQVTYPVILNQVTELLERQKIARQKEIGRFRSLEGLQKDALRRQQNFEQKVMKLYCK